MALQSANRIEPEPVSPETPASQSLDAVIERLKHDGAGEVGIVDLMSLAEHLVGSMQTIFSALDGSILREFGSIAASITEAREEIGRLQPHDISEDRIPEAGRELRAIVTATENATHSIMGAAENILGAEAETLESYREQVEAEVMAIFEACSFQDITGQRVSRVVEALEDIDERVGRIAATFGVGKAGVAEKTERQKRREARKRELILHGPADAGEGVAQGDVDEILAGDQASIDALFD